MPVPPTAESTMMTSSQHVRSRPLGASALAQASDALLGACSLAEVWQAAVRDVNACGLHGAVFSLTADRREMTLVEQGCEPAALRRIEELVDRSCREWTFPIVPGGVFEAAIEGRRAFLGNALPALLEVLPGLLAAKARPLAEALSIQQAILVPLKLRMRSGLLCVAGTGLGPGDEQAVRRYGDQLSSAIRYAGLFEQAGKQVKEFQRRLAAAEDEKDAMRKDASAERRCAAETLEAVEKDHAEVLVALNHKLRASMNGVLGSAQLLLDTRLNAKQRNLAEAVLAGGMKALFELEEIVERAAPESAEHAPEEEPFDLAACIRQALRFSLPAARERGLSITLRSPSGLPLACLGDPDRLLRLVVKLLGKAVEHSWQGEVVLLVRSLFRGREMQQVQFTVEGDSFGPGGPGSVGGESGPDLEPQDGAKGFWQICERQAVLLGGSLAAGDDKGERAAINLILPLRIDRQGGDALEQRDAPGAGRELRGEAVEAWAASRPRDEAEQRDLAAPPQVLVVDDEPSAQRVAKELLQRLGCRVEVASNGRQAVEMTSAARFDLVFMDVLMPEQDGLQATREIRRREGDRRVPIVALSACAVPGIRQRCREAGMDEFVPKPFDNRIIGALVRRLTGREESGSQEFLRILLVEGDAELQLEMMSAFRCVWPSAQIRSALAATDALVHIADMLPFLVVIDGALPRGQIQGILRAVRRDERCADTLVLVWEEGEGALQGGGVQRVGQRPDAAVLARCAAERWERWGTERSPASKGPRAEEVPILDAGKALAAVGGKLWRVRVLAASLEPALLAEVRQVEQALARGEPNAAARHLRELEMRAANVGGERLRRIARRTWVALMEGKLDAVADRVATLEEAARDLCGVLNSYQPNGGKAAG